MATSLCKCFSTSLHNPHSFSRLFAFPPSKNADSTAAFSSLNCNTNSVMRRSPTLLQETYSNHNSSAETLDFRHNNESYSEILKEEVGKRVKNSERFNLGEKNVKGNDNNVVFSNLNRNFSAETVKFRDNSEILKEEIGKRVKDDSKRVKSSERFNLGKINEKGSNINVVVRNASDNFSYRQSLFYSNGEKLKEEVGKKVKNDGKRVKNEERFNLGEKNEKGNNDDFSAVFTDETIDFRNNSEIVKEKVGLGEVNDGKRVKSGERFNLGKGINYVGRNESDNLSFGKSLFNSNGENLKEKVGNRVKYDSERVKSGERINLGKRNENGGREERVGFDRGRKWGKNNGDSGWSSRYGSKNYGNNGGRVDLWKRSEMGDGILSLKSSGSNENRDRKGGGVALKRGIVSGNVHGQVIKGHKFDNDGKVKRKEGLSRKEKANSPEFQLRVGLDMCSKTGDVMEAISLYDSAVKEGVKMGQYQYTVMLYLCSSASMGVIRPAKSGSSSRSLDKVASYDDPDGSNDSEEEEDDDTNDLDDEDLGEKLEVNEIRVSDDVKKHALEKGFEVYERMCSDKVQMNEATLTSVARMAMAMGDGDMAFDMVKQMKSIGISPKLRSYSPALSVFSSNGELEKAFAVEKHMLENGVHPEEPELAALLRVSIQSSNANKVYYVLHELRTNVRSISPSTAELIENWFRSRYASRVGKRKWDAKLIARTMENVGGGWHGQGWLGSGKWTVSQTTIVSDGLCKCCGEKLALIDLDPEETDRFAESVASIAIKRDKNSGFEKFQRWLDYYGPFEAVVDAANVGLFSQRKFKPSKVNAVVNGIRQVLPSRKWPLIILHNKRVTGGKMEEPMNKAVVDKWINADALYATPTGSNDDWYWLYAAIKFKCLLVTNDEMRDHTFQLLGNDFFPKWKERHQVRFSFSEIGPVFHMPPPCSVVIQESDKGFWHVPISSEQQSEGDRIWLCISRPKLLVMQKDPG